LETDLLPAAFRRLEKQSKEIKAFGFWRAQVMEIAGAVNMNFVRH
jgi:hypothetical protein